MAKKRERLKDIKINESGSYEYTGELYGMAPPTGLDKKSAYGRVYAGAALLTVLVTASGLIDAEVAIRAFYIVLPFVGESACLFALLWSVVKLASAKDSVKQYELDPIKNRIPAASMIMAIFALAGMIFSVVYLIRNGLGESPVKSMLYLLLKIATVAVSFHYGKFFSSIAWVAKD